MARIRLGIAILAAGRSQRFGEMDKLTVPIRGTMMGEHVAWTIGARGFDLACVICSKDAHPCEPGWRECGFEPVVNHRAAEGMGTSVALAAKRAMEERIDKLLITLADMPKVPWTHYSKLILAVDAPETIITSGIGETPMPPAVFGRDHLPALTQLSGDTGARKLLAQGEIAPCPPEWLIDIDTPEDLQRYGQ